MTWVKFDDTHPDDPRVVEAGSRAAWLNVAATCYCNRQLTDGRLPTRVVRRLVDDPDADALAHRLVSVGLWAQDGDEFVLVDYFPNQPTKAQVLDRRKSKAARQARWREKRDASVDASTDASVDAPVTPAPTRPVPQRRVGGRQVVGPARPSCEHGMPMGRDGTGCGLCAAGVAS